MSDIAVVGAGLMGHALALVFAPWAGTRCALPIAAPRRWSARLV